MIADKHWKPGMTIGDLLDPRIYVVDGSRVNHASFVSFAFPGVNTRSDEFRRYLETQVSPVDFNSGILPEIGLSQCEPTVDRDLRGDALRNHALKVVRDLFDRCGFPSEVDKPIDDRVLVSRHMTHGWPSFVLYSKTYGLIAVSLTPRQDFSVVGGFGVAVYVQAARLNPGSSQQEHAKVLKDTAYLHYHLSRQDSDNARKASEDASKDFMQSIRVLVDAARQTTSLDKISDEAFSRITDEIFKPGESK